jgi:ribosomal-protein-alanine N-acetyltransferase
MSRPAPTSPLVVSPLRRRHLRQVLAIQSAEPIDGWSLGLFLAELGREHDRRYLVARRDGRVVGYAGMLFVGDDGHLTTIGAAPAARRCGVGSALVLALALHARGRGAQALTLEVRSSNDAAVALYRRFGFAPVGVRTGYYADTGEDAMVMWATEVDGDAYGERLDGIAAAMAPVLTEGMTGLFEPGAATGELAR